MTEEEHIDSLLEDYLVSEISQCRDADIPRIVSFVENCCKKF